MIAFGGMIRAFYFQINPLMQKMTYSKISGFDEIKPNLYQQLLCFYPTPKAIMPILLNILITQVRKIHFSLMLRGLTISERLAM
jgi:hypothetical protein